MKALAILCALANLGGVGFAAFLTWFVAVFPWENTTPEERAADDWLVPVAVVLAGSAVGLLVSVAMSWQRWALAALALQTIVSLVVLSYALEGSSHSDGRLLGAAAVIELAAVSAVMLGRARPASMRATA